MSRNDYIYRERIGSGADAPLLFLFHGTGGDEDQFFDLGGQLLPGGRLIAVRGDVSENGALRYFERTGEGRYNMEDLAHRTDKMARFVAAHIGTRRPPAVFGLGYSNGANILASVQFKAPELFDATVLMHPLIPFAPPPAPVLAGRRVLITAGRRDPIAPEHRTAALAEYFERQGANTISHWHEGGHELRPEEFAAAHMFFATSVPA